MQFRHLTEGVFLQILARIPSDRDVRSVKGTCRQWHAVACSSFAFHVWLLHHARRSGVGAALRAAVLSDCAPALRRLLTTPEIAARSSATTLQDLFVFWACKNGKAASADELLRLGGADVHAQTDGALCLACRYGHLPVVELLLEAGADVHTCGGQALSWASENGHLPVVERLLEAGADARNDCAVGWACVRGHLPVVERLLAAGADVHAESDVMLRYASENGHVPMVELLLAAGADVHACSDYALRAASDNGHVSVATRLSAFPRAGGAMQTYM